MKPIHICILTIVAACSYARADDLADAGKAFDAKAYAQALQLYGKLAAAGNAEAQFRLGEMVWYGEGAPADETQAQVWLAKAAAGGHPKAVAALGVLKQRALRRADIDYWTAQYDGADLKTGAFKCQAPVIPALSNSNAEIKRIAADFAAWKNCYNGFVNNLNAALPPGKRIPADIDRLMNEQEVEQARKHLDAVYSRVGAQEMAAAKLSENQYSAWKGATEQFVFRTNERQKAIDEELMARTRAMQHVEGSTPVGPKGLPQGGSAR